MLGSQVIANCALKLGAGSHGRKRPRIRLPQVLLNGATRATIQARPKKRAKGLVFDGAGGAAFRDHVWQAQSLH